MNSQEPAELQSAMEHFLRRGPEILSRWEETVRSTLPAAELTSTLILRDHIPEFLAEMAEAILAGIEYGSRRKGGNVASRVATTLASSVISSEGHGAQRALLTEYNLGQLLHEYRILRKVTFDCLERSVPLNPHSREILNDAIDRAMELAAVEFTRVQQEALVRSEAQSRMVIENAADYAIFMADPAGNILTWNVGAERLTGFNSEEVLGKPLSCLYDQQSDAAHLTHDQPDTCSDASSAHHQVLWKRKGEAAFWVSTVVTDLRDCDGGLTGFGVVTRDISERRSWEEALRARVEELGVLNQHMDDFLAMLSHELRNPLAAVKNSIQVMERTGPGTPAFERANQIAKRQIQHQIRLVEDLLDVSRLMKGKIQLVQEPLDLTRLVRDTVEDGRSQLEHARLNLTVDLPEHPVWVVGDPTRLAQVLGNLLQNAAKFTVSGGDVQVSLRGDGRVELTVRDTGIGLSPSVLPTIFDPFTQVESSPDRPREGLGLGLALVKGIVELHGGSVTVRSEGVGHGAEFVVELPLHEGTPEGPIVPTPVGVRTGPRRVLVIEDSPDGAATLQDLLELYGHQVALAHSGSEGLRAVTEFDPEVVLCDIGLPGISGYEVAEALRSQPPGSLLLLVALTGYGRDEDRKRSRAAGFDTHLTKPIDVDELLKLIARGHL